MTTKCKHCGKLRENHYEKIDGRACCTPNGKGTVFEPSTEGTQADQPNDGGDLCDCDHPRDGHMIDGCDAPHCHCREFEMTIDRSVPAPVAQVDAGKCHHIWGWDRVCMACGEDSLEPAAAQTELPPIPPMPFKKVDSVAKFTGLTEDQTKRFVGCLLSVGLEIVESQAIASLTQRLQASEAREAELKAEIAKMQMDNVIDYKAACEQHAANYEALERSHAKLKRDFWFNDFRPVIDAIGEISVQEAMDAIEKEL